MKVTVFYVWQSDSDENVNRYFIRKAAQEACDRITEDDTNEWQVRFDYDMRDVVGMGNINAEILKKLGSSDIFIVDTSLIAKTAAGKDLPNPNAIFELGYAAGRHGFEPLIGVMNEASGSLNGQIFDITQRSSLTYRLATGTDKATVAKTHNELSKNLEGIIRATIVQVTEPRRKELEGIARESDEKPHAEFIEKVLNGGFYGHKLFPAVIHSIKFNWSKACGFREAIKAVKALGVNYDVSEHEIAWNEPSLRSELHDFGILRRVATNDVVASKTIWDRQGSKSWPVDFLYTDPLQRFLVSRIETDCKMLGEWGIEPPWTICTSLVKADGWKLLNREVVEAPKHVSNPKLTFPSARVTSVGQFKDMAAVGAIMKDGFDYMCRHVGWDGSGCFNDDGTWNSTVG
jgi:hypothetical protein